jgi:predicted unusual protein kinase regulating ubiquinone biosynthesis (AarF/ABC1/UbiB family)
MFQWHRATIDDGKTVTMKILRPEFEQQLQREQQALRSLERARVGLGDGTELDVATALTDFDAFVQRRINLQLEKDALAHMADAVGVFDCFVVPDTCVELCTRRVVTTVALASERRLAPGAIGFTAGPANLEYDTQGEKPDVDLARRLALLWLQQALLTSMYPEGPFEGDMVNLGDGRLGVSGGSFGRLDPDCRRSLLQYLTAVAKDEPIRACDLLLDHCDADEAASKRETMRNQFRQAEPFRSGGWSDNYKGRRLADNLFVQWRLARQGGYRPKPHMEAFMRGLFAVEGQARRIAADWDGLREGVNNLRVIVAITRIREHLGPTQFEENMHQFIETGSTIMRKLAEGPVTQDRTSIAKTAPKRYSAMWIAVSGLSLMLVSLALILERLTVASANPLMSEKAAAIIFIAVTLGTIWYLRPTKEEE